MKHYTYPDLQRYSPFRRTDWRWQRAHALIEQSDNFSRLTDDDWTRQAVRYLRASQKCLTDQHRARLTELMPALCSAHWLHEDTSSTKLIVQARLLARQTVAEIAALTNLPAELIETYEAIFFNVLDRIDARDWILLRAITRGHENTPLSLAAGATLKRFSYFAGADVLDLVLPHITGSRSAQPPDLSTPEGRLERSVRRAVALELLPDDYSTRRTLIRLRVDQVRAGLKPVAGQVAEIGLVAAFAEQALSNPEQIVASMVVRGTETHTTTRVGKLASAARKTA